MNDKRGGEAAARSEASPWKLVVIAMLLQYAAYVVMQTSALFAETRRGPTLPDVMHDLVAVNRSLDFLNSVVWLPLLLVSIFILSIFRPYAAVNYLRVGAAMSLLRGLFIPLTTLGPPAVLLAGASPTILNLKPADITWPLLVHHWMPLDVFLGGSGFSAVYLTQDLFFSGHTSTTFLLVIASWRNWKDNARTHAALHLDRGIFVFCVLVHVVTVVGLFLTHEHYTIDVLAAYFFVYAGWKFFEARGWLTAVRR